MLHLKIVVEGRVQGVCFRAYTQKKALQLEIQGTVRNKLSGCVEIQAAGEEKNMHDFLHFCHKGPVMAKVTTITKTVIPAHPDYTGFKIID